MAGLAGLRYEDNAAGGEIRTELAEEVLLRWGKLLTLTPTQP